MDTPTPIPILSPKLQIPPSRLHLVSRERLLATLNSGLHRKLTLISAPAGYGKTTLLSEWAALTESQLGWITLNPGDNDTERFLTYFIHALQNATNSLSNLDSILGVRISLQPIPPDAVLAILVNELSGINDQLALVLDDYQVVENPEIHEFLVAFLDHMPANVHLLVSSRSDPPLRVARLRAKNQLNEITEKDLRFTHEEAEAFFDGVMGLQLTEGQVSKLGARTEGWITGLQLAGLSLKDREHPAELIETLSGTHRYILDYLIEEVFSDLPLILQTFLLRVSILERLTSGLCDALVADQADESGQTLQSKGILEFLDTSNLFVVPLDSQRQWFRFHPLFADFLKDRLANVAPQELAGLHQRAASWYADHELLPEAVQHSFAAGNLDYVADLIEAQAKAMLGRGEVSTLLGWIEDFPEETINARPQLGLARAWGTLMYPTVESRTNVVHQMKQIAQGLGVSPGDLLHALKASEPKSPHRAELSEFAILQAFIQRDGTDITQTIRLFQAALKYLPERELVLRGFTQAGLGSTYVRFGKIKRAEELFAQAAQTSMAANSTYGYVVCTDWQATAQAEQGRLTQAAETYQVAIDALSTQGGYPLPLSGHVYVGLASVLLEWNELEEALQNVELGLKVGAQVRDVDALLSGYPIQARVLQALNRREETRTALHLAEQQALETQHETCVDEAQAQKATLALLSGDLEEARRWATARGLGVGAQSELEPPPVEIERLTYARLLMAEGKSEAALPILTHLFSAQEQMGRMRAGLENLSLQALCYRALGHTDDAVHTLARALLQAEPEKFARIFIESGPPMAALLRTVGAQGHSPEYVKRLLVFFGETAGTGDVPVEALSERELEVLRLVADGLTNTEIAAELVIAQSTVKSHINHIYSKLGVSSRTQAVARGRQLQILS